jgi:hypothetical protein
MKHEFNNNGDPNMGGLKKNKNRFRIDSDAILKFGRLILNHKS